MAQDWVLAYGILSDKEAEKLLQKVNNRGNNPKGKSSSAANKLKSPEKAKPAAKAPAQPPAKRARGGKSKINEDEDIGGDDIGGVWEGQGSSGI